MNSQTWASGSPPANSAGPSERAGLTEVPVSGMPTRCTAVSARPIASPAKPGRGGPAGDQQDHRHEDEGEQHLEDEGAAQADGGAVVVGAERAGLVGDVAEAAGQQLQDRRAGDAAGELGDPVVGRLGRRHALREQHAEGDRRVDVAAGDRADRVGQREQRQAEREGDAERRRWCRCR